MQTETITNTGQAIFTNLTRYEHHKIDLIVSDFSSNISLKIEDISNNTNTPINLDASNKTYTLSSNGAESFLLENTRLEKMQVNISAGAGTIICNYTGW